MCDMLMDSICRLCLKDNFTLVNIYSSRTPFGEPVFRVLNEIYDLKISKEDRLPSKICVPCLWRMYEFDTYKKNVKYAESELGKLLRRTSFNTDEVSNEEPNDNDVFGEEEIPINDASDHPDARVSVKETEVSMKQEIDIFEWTMPEEIQPEKDILDMSIGKSNGHKNAECDVLEEEIEVPIKDEIVIVEWEMPNELQSKADIDKEHCSERHLSLEEGINSIDNEMESTEVISSRMDLEGKKGILRYEKVEQMKISLRVESEQQEEESIERNKEAYESISSETCEAITSECVRDRNESAEIIVNGSSVVSNSENMYKNEGEMQEDGLNDGIEEDESFDALILESSDNLEESGATRSVTPVERKKKDFFCDICKKSFVSKYNLGRHVRVHNYDRPFKCNKCGKAFKLDNGRKRHELLHLRNENRKNEDGNTSKPFSCDICEKQFKTHTGLLYHSNVHKNKYKCRICGKSFGCNSDLNVHLRIHTNEKPFSCKVCKMTFTQKSNLNKHLATHSDDHPFKCNVCHKRFKSQGVRYQHELLHLRSN